MTSMVQDKQDFPYSDDEINKYQAETGKHAIWRGNVTEGFLQWRSGKKIYNRDRERIALYVPEETKDKWQSFIIKDGSLTISKLIRQSVDFFIEFQSKNPGLRKLSEIARILKGPLTGIKGFAQLIAETHGNELSNKVHLQIREIIEKSIDLEEKITLLLEDEPLISESKYDIFIVDTDASTIKILTNFFEYKGLKCKGLTTGSRIFADLKTSKPKVILMDILLPDVDGYETCKLIKQNPEFSTIPFYIISALPACELELRTVELNANGYFTKPFNFKEFKALEKFFS